ncbi:hypothetical protein Tco_0787622 [Tanacetum coccineum]
MGTHDDEVGSSRPKRSRQYKIVKEVLLPQVHHEFLEWEGCNRDAKSTYNSPCVMNWDILNRMGCGEEIDGMLRINLCEAGTNEEIFTSVAWIRAFTINEPIYSELCYEFYSTYEFDEVCTDDELGLYHADELDEEGFDVYFQRGLCSDEHFNAQEYWLSISREENLSLSRSHASTIRNPVLRVLHKMITYTPKRIAEVSWLIARWMKRKGAGNQRESMICCGRFIMKIARKARVLSDEVIRTLSAQIVAIPRPQRASMQDLYKRMGSMEIHKGAIERIPYRQSYHWDRYVGVFKHIAGVYSVPLQGAYNPPGYDQQQYDQYY